MEDWTSVPLTLWNKVLSFLQCLNRGKAPRTNLGAPKRKNPIKHCLTMVLFAGVNTFGWRKSSY